MTSRPVRRSHRRGNAAVEFALVAPLLILLLLGLWEVGRLVEVQQTVNMAAREGGRQASTGQKDVSGVQQTVTNYLTRAGINTQGITVTVTNMTNNSRSDPTTANQMDRFRITVTLPFNNVRWVMLNQITNTQSLTAQSDWYSMRDLPVTVSTTLPVE